MFEQFRSRYSSGCLISELVTIERGKYVVRALVTVGGATLASGLAAAETLEQAEDRARIRALAVLGIHPNAAEKTSQATSGQTRASSVEPALKSSFQSEKSLSPDPQAARNSGGTQKTAPDAFSPQTRRQPPPPVSPAPPEPPPEVSQDWLSSTDRTRPWVPPAHTPNCREDVPFSDMESAAASEPTDLSDAVAKIEVTLSKLRVNSKQEQDFLKRTYGKSNRSLLDDSELQQFLEYLEVYEKISDEMDRLGWQVEQGRACLKQIYGKEGRIQLTREELDEFLEYLKTQ